MDKVINIKKWKLTAPERIFETFVFVSFILYTIATGWSYNLMFYGFLKIFIYLYCKHSSSLDQEL